jgi:hypothetical protein
MKKLIAILVVLTLVAGAAFAQAVVGVTIDTRLSIEGDTRETPTGQNYAPGAPTISGRIADAYFEASGENDEGTLGATVRIRANLHGALASDDTAIMDFHRAFIWWRPIPQLRIFLGKEADGMFSTGNALTDWAFHRGAENYLNYHDWDYWRAVFPGNWDDFGLALSVYPIEGLELNFVIPTGTGGWDDDANVSMAFDDRELYLEDIFQYIRFQASYVIPDIGTIFFSWIGPQMHDRNIHSVNGHSGNIGASFLLTAIDGLQVQAGFSTYLAKDSASNKPMLIGLAAHYEGDGFGVKFRSAFEIGGMLTGAVYSPGSWRFGNNATVFTKGNAFQFNVMPWYNMDFMEIRCDIGFRMNMYDTTPVNALENSWYFNPYVRVPIPGGRFQAGLKVHGNNNDDHITYVIPMGLVFSF